MIDLPLMASLLEAIPENCRLVLVGDADQLPSVGPGKILGDLVSCGTVPVATLRQVYRQAGHSGIIRNAWRVNQGERPISGEREPSAPGVSPDFFVLHRPDPLEAQATVLEVVLRRLPALGFDPLRDVQVLTPMHNGPLGTDSLNQQLQRLLDPGPVAIERGERVLRVGDRVLQTRNDYDHDIFNGDTGRILSAHGGRLVVDFDGREVQIEEEGQRHLQLAYAMSIHKSQGSEYPAVIVVIHRAHWIMLRRNLIYTALTRARRFCCLIGDPWAIDKAAEEEGGSTRWTRLAQWIGE
jgi:exodeoxyribonuclease V alpha subunit